MGTTHQYAFGTQQNQLLAALPAEDLNRWQSRLEMVELSRNQLLHSAGTNPEYIYFPTTAIVSLITVTSEGQSAEVAVVGNDGVVGVSYLLGADLAATDATVQSEGRAFRVSARFVKGEVEQPCGVMKVLMRYAQDMMAQMAQTAVCNRFHSIDQQLARRLLVSLDRVSGNELQMTHELAANLIGVRREGVTVAATKLKEQGTIEYSRGKVVVLDREELEQNACECYSASIKQFSRLLPRRLAA